MGAKQMITRSWRGARSLWAPPPDCGDERPKRDYEDINKVNTALLPLLGLGLAAATWVGWRACAVGPVLLWCVACLAVGATGGFLFGIPRSGSQSYRDNVDTDDAKTGEKADPARSNTRADGGRPNTNLEEVSDWLTKIIVGLTLVHLKTIEERVMSISRNAAATLDVKPTDTDVSIATALIVGFAVIGFLCGYLYTRLFLQGAMMR